MAERRLSCRMVRMESRQAVRLGPPGGFYIEQEGGGVRTMYCKLPEGSFTWLSLRPPTEKPSWEFDGNMEQPTLHPSVHYIGCWHGWFKSGQMETCGNPE